MSVIQTNNNSIYYWHGGSVLFLNSIETQMHRHYPVEIYIGLDDDFTIDFGNECSRCRTAVAASNQPHQIVNSNGRLALFLLDVRYYGLSMLERRSFELNSDAACAFTKQIEHFLRYSGTCIDAKKLANEAIVSLINQGGHVRSTDKRIKDLMTMLDSTTHLNPTSRELAQYAGLSESRLAHLFKAQTGIPIRRYLLWLKVRHAIQMIMDGEQFTTAAHASGFSDSAHFSRTYKQMFGVSPSTLLKPYQPVNIQSAFCTVS